MFNCNHARNRIGGLGIRVYNIEELLRKIAHLIEGYLYPHRHGEFRPIADFWVGLIPIVIGILLFIPALSEGWPWVGWLIILGIIAFGIFLWAATVVNEFRAWACSMAVLLSGLEVKKNQPTDLQSWTGWLDQFGQVYSGTESVISCV